MKLRLTCLALVLALLPGCDPAPPPDPPPGPAATSVSAETPISGAVEHFLAEYATQHRGALGVPALSVAAVLPDGTVVAAASGWADPERRIAVTPATRFLSGSTGKTFCAALAMKLVEDGRLKLDDKLAPLFSGTPWFDGLPNHDAVTLRMLLNHTAGFPQFLELNSFRWSYLVDVLRGREVDYSPQKMLSFIDGAAPLNAPGAAFNYSDLGYDLAGLTIERITGQPYFEAMQQRILTPLSYGEITPATSKALPQLAAGYAQGDFLENLLGLSGRSTDQDGILKRSPVLEYAGGGLSLTPRALAQFYADLMRGRVVKPETAEAMSTPAIHLPSTPPIEQGFGLGLFVTDRPGFGRYVSHSGFYPGYNANVGYFSDFGIAVAVQVNRDHVDLSATLRELAEGTAKAAGIPAPGG
jgi:D-alanyl-D-alanine carboxypeptidase